MAPDYPWYCVTEGDDLQQGDLLRAFPVIIPVNGGAADPFEPEIEVDIQYFNVLVMTHSCDLAQEKVDTVVLCPHVDIAKAQEVDEDLKAKHILKEIQKGKFIRYQLLAPSNTDILMPVQVLDFGRVVSMPKDFVRSFAGQSGKRLRLLPPYREHIAQSFARCYMRVALPISPLAELSSPQAGPATVPALPPRR